MIQFIALILALFMTVSCMSGTNNPVNSGDLKTPNYELVKLKNGIEVYFIQDKSLPIFTVQGVLAAGSYDDYKGKSGVTSLMVSMLKEGSGGLSSSAYKALYSKYSSEFNIDVDKDTLYFQSSGLSKYDREITKLFFDTIFKPHFIQNKKASSSIRAYDKVRKKRQAEILNSMERASYFASISFASLLHGDEGYGAPEWGTAQGIKMTLLKDVKDYYNEFVTTQNLQFALSGNYTDETKKIFLDMLNSIPPSKRVDEKKSLAKGLDEELGASKIIVINKPNLKQAEIRIGHIGPKRLNENYIPLYIANSAIGSGDFTTRLMQEIRVKKGLVYGISSWFYGFKNGGTFVISGSTRHEKITEVIKTTLDVIKSAANEGISKEELSTQKNVLIGQFPLKFETHESYLQQLMRYKTYGFDKDYITTFYNQIKNLKVGEANEVLKTYYKPENALIVVYASKKKLPKDLNSLGLPIEYKNYKKVFK